MQLETLATLVTLSPGIALALAFLFPFGLALVLSAFAAAESAPRLVPWRYQVVPGRRARNTDSVRRAARAALRVRS